LYRVRLGSTATGDLRICFTHARVYRHWAY
jgi:hypothetical protein